MLEKITLWIKNIRAFLEEKNIGKDKLLLLGLGFGLLFTGMIFSGDSDKKEENTPVTDISETNQRVRTEEEYIKEMEDKLRDIICQVEGVGSVDVFISYEGSYEKVVLKEQPYTKSETKETDSEGGVRVVVSENSDEAVVYDAEDEPYVIKTMVPQVTGVAVVAEGGDNPVIIQKINNIIKALFDIEVNKIAVVGK